MTETGHVLQIVSVTKSHSFVLEERELEQLLLREDVRDLPVVVVSVAGAYRGGKSFLLNFFLRYLSAPLSARKDGSWLGGDGEPLTGFPWRKGSRMVTTGVQMWSEPFITRLHEDGEEVAVLLVDTQGSFNSTSTVRDNSTIFVLSTLISSVQIYNLSSDIKEDDLQLLELLTEYGKLVNADSNGKAFQVLDFLVRDWMFPEDFSYGAVGGELLLQQKLEITDDLPNEMKELRQHIRSSFNKVSGFLMPHPGFKVLSSTFKGNISDIEPEFRVQLKDLVNSIFSPEKVLPKTIHGERVKACDLFNYFKTYMELFNSGMIPTPYNILAATVKANLLSAVGEARHVYERGMDAQCGPKQLSVPAVDVKFLHEKYVARACAAYNEKTKMGSSGEIAYYLEKMTKDLNERLSQFLQSNSLKNQIAIDKAKQAYDESYRSISNGEPLCVHTMDLQEVHKAGKAAAIKIYDASRKRVTTKHDDERTAFIEEIEKQYESQSLTNILNNDDLVSKLLKEYYNRMLSMVILTPTLFEEEFKEEHEFALKKALEDFEWERNKPNHYTYDDYKYILIQKIKEKYNILQTINKSYVSVKQAEIYRAQQREQDAREGCAYRRKMRKLSIERHENESKCTML